MNNRSPRRRGRSTRSKAFALALTAAHSLCLLSCLERPVAEQHPKTTNIILDTLPMGTNKLDLLFMIDNSVSMADKQKVLGSAVPELVRRLIDPVCVSTTDPTRTAAPRAGKCEDGYRRQFDPLEDVHIAVISSSLGSFGTSACDQSPEVLHPNDQAHLIPSVRPAAELISYNSLAFLAWDPKERKAKAGQPAGETDSERLITNFQAHVTATGETGCGFEASLESWYRFLIQPDPPASWLIENDRARPDGLDTALLDQRKAFLRPDSLVAIIMLTDENDCSINPNGHGWLAATQKLTSLEDWFMPRGNSVCRINPQDPCCRPCGKEPDGPPAGCESLENDEVCAEGLSYTSRDEDVMNLRCFDQKRRFGVDFLYPIQRYLDGLRSPTVPDRQGNPQPNPLYTDLTTGAPAPRQPSQVFLAGIVGVPWQDIATDESRASSDTLRYMTAAELTLHNRWPLLLGDPEANTAPRDPLMIESILPREGQNPLLGVDLAPPQAPLALQNPINGHEYETNNRDLQYACIFRAPQETECADNPNCDCSSGTLTPLCQDPNTGEYTGTQYFAKAYPGTRQLELLRAFGDNAIVASICPRFLPEADSGAQAVPEGSQGYNPAVDAIISATSKGLTGRCISRELFPDPSGKVPCAVVESLPAVAGSCTPCDSIPGRAEVAARLVPSVRKRLREAERCGGDTGVDCASFCLCEITQPQGEDLVSCQNDLETEVAGFCYVDPEKNVGSEELVGECPGKRTLRFGGDDTPRPGSLTFIACSGSVNPN